MPEPAEQSAAEPPRPPAVPARRTGRRARTEPPAGSDPAPQPEPPRHRATDNDARLRADKPPHY